MGDSGYLKQVYGVESKSFDLWSLKLSTLSESEEQGKIYRRFDEMHTREYKESIEYAR